MIAVHPRTSIHRLADVEYSVRGTSMSISAYATVDAFIKIKPAGGMVAVLIGANLTILDANFIPERCLVASGTLVRHQELLAHHVHSGIPLPMSEVRE